VSLPSEFITPAVTLLLLGTGAVVDVRTRRIPNVLTLGTTAAGVLLAASGVTGVSVGQSLAGAVLGMALMMPGHLLGATGAGDVKALGAAGALLGVRRVPAAFLYTAIAGGILAIVVAIARGRLAPTLGGLGRVVQRVGQRASARPLSPDGADEGRPAEALFAYGPAIAVGSVMAALGI